MGDPIRVLVVDDSIVMRHLIAQSLEAADDVEVVGHARDGEEGLAQARALKLDVITLDVIMPRFDGLSMLETLMRESPTPVIMLSGVIQQGSDAAIRALSLGAVDFLAKPAPGSMPDRKQVAADLVQMVRSAAISRPRDSTFAASTPTGHSGVTPTLRPARLLLILIGCSTGGPQALNDMIPLLPPTLDASVLVVQHMPARFTRTLADRLNMVLRLSDRETREADPVRTGESLVAPGNLHLVVGETTVRLHQAPPQHGVRPSIDVTLESAAVHFGSRALAAVLTGMGVDGARGSALLKNRGARSAEAEHWGLTPSPRGVSPHHRVPPFPFGW